MAAENKTLTWNIAPDSKGLFCPDCMSILDLPDTTDIISCFDCPFRITVAEMKQSDQVQNKNYDTREAAKASGLNPTMRRATVEEPCPNCEYHQLRFYTMQMRSVDEGQTVFYECEKCGHTYSTNT